ncbi:MAG TPA: delta-lactam-biosynthetic de-N-acetylase [Clostridiaceae bacterium]|nr:delta-lactam-biosynthetic de-N-acetylase [Clostridiaceae bacterium]
MKLIIAIISVVLVLVYVTTLFVGSLLPLIKGAGLQKEKETYKETRPDDEYDSEKNYAGQEDEENDIEKEEVEQAEEYGKSENVHQDSGNSNTGSSNESQQDQDNENQPVEQKPELSEILNFEELDKLDNTKYSWWINQNTEHVTPGIPEVARKLIDKYDGIFTGDTTQKHIYLTFDEGYENGYTSKILDVLKENDVKSIFFVTGSYIEKNPDLIKRMLQEGHKVGNHTVNHPSLPGVDNSRLEKELAGLEERFFELYGERFEYMRPPMGEYSERVLAAAKQLGYKTVFWSFAYKDYDVNDQKGQEYAYNKIMSNLHNGAVLLLHAVSKDNAEVLDRLIKDIRAQGYEIRPFDL